ncbi:MAG: hypothetical protein LBE04_04280 [Prevotellaceae bacterium]|jgi:hypothetical protein|nr:hypothetical protein [Prevotellaceae bacterium]
MSAMEGIFKYGEKQPDFGVKYGIGRIGPNDTLPLCLNVSFVEDGRKNLSFERCIDLHEDGKAERINIDNVVLLCDTARVDSTSLTGAWITCALVRNSEIWLYHGDLKIICANGAFSNIRTRTGKEWANGTIANVTSDSYVENVVAQTSSIFAGKSVKVRYTLEKVNSYTVLKMQYLYGKDTGNQKECWIPGIPEIYVKIPDSEAEKIVSESKIAYKL